jgi:hypothetical protein
LASVLVISLSQAFRLLPRPSLVLQILPYANNASLTRLLQIVLSRSKTILSGANGDVIMSNERAEPFCLELVLYPTGS